MYIDYLKNDYSNKKEQEREEYIARDKKHLAGLIQERITNDIEHIVDNVPLSKYFDEDGILKSEKVEEEVKDTEIES